MSILKQKTPIPFILILIIVTAIAVVAYQSPVRNDQISKMQFKAPIPTPSSEDIALDQSGRLASDSASFKFDENSPTSPKFSFFPPAGWSKLPPKQNIIVEFLAPVEDKVELGMAYISVQPNITVYLAKKEFKNLEEAVLFFDRAKPTEAVNRKEKVKINGEDAYVFETIQDISDSLKNDLESKVNDELAKAASKRVTRADVQKDVDKVLKQAKVKMISYIFYKSGYYIHVTGKALETFWDKRGPQIKSSLDTFVYLDR